MSKSNKRIILIIAIVVIVLVTVGIAVGIGMRKKMANRFEGIGMKRQSTMSLTKRDLSNSISVTGSLASAKTKAVSANMNGAEVEKVYVEVGDMVKKGDKLVLFDLTELKENLADAKAQTMQM